MSVLDSNYTILPVSQNSYEIGGDRLQVGKNYSAYVGFYNTTQTGNPEGFKNASGSNSSEPLLVTYAGSSTKLNFTVYDPNSVSCA